MAKKQKQVLINHTFVDWVLLRKQKRVLVKAASESPSKWLGIKDAGDSLDGLIALLDWIQDEASEQLGERKVFGIKR